MVGRVQAEETQTQSNIIFPSALPRLKLFVWISLIPTYNSGIEQYFNYTKHFGKNRGGRGGLQMWKNSFCLLRPFLFLDERLILGLFCYSESRDSRLRKTRNRQRWLQQDPPCLDCHLLLFWSWEWFYLYTEHGSMGHSSILDLSFGWTGASFGSCYGLIPAHLVWSKRHEEETDGQTR